VVVGCSAELTKRGKEMIMAGFSAGTELPHGERVQQMAIERAVLQGRARGKLASAGVARWLRDRKIRAIHTQTIFHSKLDKALRIDRAGKMVVKIAALGHLLQEDVQEQWLIADRLKISCGLLLR
jgi:hypothetical protein